MKIMRILKNIIREFLKRKLDYNTIYNYGSKNPDITFFVIKDSNPYSGILSDWFRIVGYVQYALDKEYVPIIDFKNYFMPLFMDKDGFQKYNYWDFYFKQPCLKYSLDEVYNSKNVIIEESIWGEKSDRKKKYILEASKSGKKVSLLSDSYVKLFNKYYNLCPFSEIIEKEAEDFYQKYFPKNEKVLGISFRRTYEWCHFVNSENTPLGTHHVFETLDTLVKKIPIILKELNYNYFFLVVDDSEACQKIKDLFPLSCIVMDRFREKYFVNNKPIPKESNYSQKFEGYNEKDGSKKRNIYYLTEVLLLSKCYSLFNAGGTADIFAYALNNGKYEKVF